jgi:hypothetical protein
MKWIRWRRPSPALVVAIIAVVISCTGTAVASHYLITSSKQIKKGVITGANIRDGSVSAADLAPALRTNAASNANTAGSGAFEAFRKTGPDLPDQGYAPVATLSLQPGAYAIFAKVNLAPGVQDQGLLNTLLKSNKTIEGRCQLDAAGDIDESAGALVSPGTQNVLMLEEQITRTLATPGVVTLSCRGEGAHAHASDASIVAMSVDRASRVGSQP